MKVNQSLTAVLLGVCLLLEPTSSTILTTTLFTGFVGGFLVGKVTLGTFLTIMNSLNRGQTSVASRPASAASTAAASSGSSASTQTQTVVTRGGSEEEGSYQFQDISPSLENQVRDRFLRELGKMDPLSCLPKVFCEISADPTTANGLFGDTGIFANQIGLNIKSEQPQPKKPKKKVKKYLKKPKDEVEDDVQEGDEDEEGSESEESDEEDEDEVQDEESMKLQRYEMKENQALESKALDELIDEFDDPISYYFILKDKKKNIHPELHKMMSEADLSRMDSNRRRSHPAKNPKKQVKNRPSMLIRRIGQAAKSSVESSSRTIVPKISTPKTTEPSTDDAFASDPFFDEFSKSLNEPKPKNSIKFGQIELLRRSKRYIIDDDEHDATMAKYRMAAKVAEKFKDPAKCQKVFSTCPFSSEEVMNMITKMNEEDSSPSTSFSYSVKKKNKKKKTHGQDDGLKNLKNTLLAIEKLNDVTVHAQFSGEPVDYEKIIREAADSTASETSDKILEDFEQFEDHVEEPQRLEKSPKKKSKKKNGSSGGNKNNKKVVTRHRRHGELPEEQKEEVILQSQRSRTSRLSLVSPSGPQKASRVTYSSFEDDGESEEEDKLPYSSSIESKLQTRLQLRPPQRQRPQKPSYTSSQETSNKSKLPAQSEEEDDEVNSPEYEQTRVKVPTFSQSFQETVQTPAKIRNKPRPVHPIVKVKDQSAKAPTTSATTALPFRSKPEGSNSGTRYSPKPKPGRPQGATSHQKFSGELEDDEEDAVISEKHVGTSSLSSNVPKYKPRRPTSSSSRNSYISS